MKYLFYLFAICTLFFLTSCKNSEVPNTDNEGYQVTLEFENGDEAIVLDIKDNILNEPSFSPNNPGYAFGGWSMESLSDTAITFPFFLTKDITLYAVWVSTAYDYSKVIEEYVPDIILGNLDLPLQDGEYNYTWYSSNPTILSNYGEVFPTRSDEKVQFYVDIYYRGIIHTYSKEVVVKGIELPKLSGKEVVFGYYSSWNFFGITEEMKKTVDVINLSFAYVNQDGTLDISSLQAVLGKIVTAHTDGIRVVLSIQGYGSGGTNFSNIAKAKKGREKFAASCLEFIEKYHFDGIDIDWEYPGFGTGTTTQIDKANYTLLVEELNKTLKNACSDYIVSAAIPGGPYLTSRFDLENVSKYLDYIHIMTYDLQTSSKATHHSALYDSSGTVSGCSVDKSVKEYLLHHVEKEKIIIGIAFYGKSTTAKGLSLSASGGYKAIVYTKIKNEYLSKIGSGIDYYYDEVAHAPYLIDEKNNLFITYEDERSIEAKCNYVKDNSLGGVMIWELGEDQTNTLLLPIYENLKK